MGRWHDPEVDRVVAAADQARQRLAAALQAFGPTPDRAAVENPACPCWSGFHTQHEGVCGCPTCESEEERHEWARDTCSDCGTPLGTVTAQNAGRCQSCLFKRL